MITNWSGLIDLNLPCIVLRKIPISCHSALKESNVPPPRSPRCLQLCVEARAPMCLAPIFCTRKPFLCCFGCVCVAVFGTEPDKREFKGMELWMIKCDTGEGEKRWTPLGEELSSCLSRGRRFLESNAGNWNHFVLLLHGSMNPLVFVLATFQNTLSLIFNLHSVSSWYLEHLQSQDVEWLLSKVTRFSSLWFAELHYVSVVFTGHRPEL